MDDVSWIESINGWIGKVNGIVWGLPTVILLVGSGILLTLLLKGIQIRGFRHAIQVVRGRYDHPGDPGEVSHFQALCAALSATVGLGNIAGVAIAIGVGGPGAVFWMIIVGLVGMATKYSECTLGLMYRRIDEKGVVHGGPMYYIEKGLGRAWKPMAILFAICTIFATFGAANMFQTNQVALVSEAKLGIPKEIVGITLAILVGLVILGGIKRIGKVAAIIVPFMGGVYVLGALIIIALNITELPGVLLRIITEAFTGTEQVAGGFAGAVFKTVLISGVRRACFSNEAGIGSAPFAHSAAATTEPVREGTVALLEPFIDTVIICTMTAIVFLLSGVWEQGAPDGWANGALRTAEAFDHGLANFGTYFIPIAVFFFAYSTLLSWSYYGERAVDYIFKGRGLFLYKLIFCAVAYLGAVWQPGVVINFSEMTFGMMMYPNLIAVWLLFPILSKATKEYFDKLKAGKFPLSR